MFAAASLTDALGDRPPLRRDRSPTGCACASAPPATWPVSRGGRTRRRVLLRRPCAHGRAGAYRLRRARRPPRRAVEHTGRLVRASPTLRITDPGALRDVCAFSRSPNCRKKSVPGRHLPRGADSRTLASSADARCSWCRRSTCVPRSRRSPKHMRTRESSTRTDAAIVARTVALEVPRERGPPVRTPSRRSRRRRHAARAPPRPTSRDRRHARCTHAAGSSCWRQ